MKFEILEAKPGKYEYNGKVIRNCVITLSPDNYESDGRLTDAAFKYFCKQGEGTFAHEFRDFKEFGHRSFYLNNGILAIRDEKGAICKWFNSYIKAELRRKSHNNKSVSTPKKDAPKKDTKKADDIAALKKELAALSKRMTEIAALLQ